MTTINAPEVMRVPATREVIDYVVAHGSPPDDVLLDLIESTRQAFGQQAGMQIAPEQGALLAMLTKLVGAKNAVEVGTFTGYSALCIARALPADGHLLCCDISEDWTDMGVAAWERAGVADRIDLVIAPALQTLRALDLSPVIDISFVDADKVGYAAYYEELIIRTRPGGLIVFDNVLFAGKVLGESTEANPVALRRFNDDLVTDDRVDVVMLPLADGVTIARKR
jgi:caffeoyl-CoA O-methyltransferase